MKNTAVLAAAPAFVFCEVMKMEKEDKLLAILVVLGMLLTVTGIALISIPAALIVAGVLLIVIAANGAKRREGQNKI